MNRIKLLLVLLTVCLTSCDPLVPEPDCKEDKPFIDYTRDMGKMKDLKDSLEIESLKLEIKLLQREILDGDMSCRHE